MIFWILLAILILGGIVTLLHPDPGAARQEMVRRLTALLWAATIGALITTIALVIGLLWLIIGAIWVFITGSERLSPKGGVASTIRELLRWNVGQIEYGLTGSGDSKFFPPIEA
jgi:hypothetical protein